MAASRACPRCQAAASSVDGLCVACGHPLSGPDLYETVLDAAGRPGGQPPAAPRPAPAAGLEPVPGMRLIRPADAPLPADYQVIERIGSGGMGVVCAARQARLERTVAIKMVRRELAEKPEACAKFLAEALVTGSLDHPNIVPVYELGEDQDGCAFFAMKHVQGKPWSTLIRDQRLNENLDILMRVADAVAFAHTREIIHRDLKPENVMLGEFGEVMVVDWGMAVAIGTAGKAERLTAGSPVAGTPAYMAPEMARNDHDAIGVASDVYLLGAILYQIITGRAPHTGRTLAECLAAASGNRIEHYPAGGGLLDIALIAMATRPEDRYRGVKEFQAALRTHHTHLDSQALCHRAELKLEEAELARSYAAFARALFGFEEALAQWADNAAASRGASRARLAYATCAFERGDLDLAASQLDESDPAHAGLVQRIANDRRARREAAEKLQREQAARLQAESQRRELEARIETESRREWQLVFSDDLSGLDLGDRWRVIGGEWEMLQGELRVWGGQPHLVVLQQPVAGDLRLEFECHLESDYLNDVSCFIAGLPSSDALRTYSSGYEFKYGGYSNTRTMLLRCHREMKDLHASPLVKGRRYRVRAERIGSRLSLTVDDELVFSVVDEEPLGGSERTVIGLFGWMADNRYSKVRVYQLSAPRKADLLESAEQHLQRGHYNTAVDLFGDILESNQEPARLERARRGLERARHLGLLVRQLPSIQAQLGAACPRAEATIGNHGLVVRMANARISDLSLLAGLPISELDCTDNGIVSLEPLRGMPLCVLHCDRNAIADLEPLHGMPLTTLSCASNRIVSLEPLRGLPLVAVTCGFNRIADLGPLSGMRLSSLHCPGNLIASLEALRGMPLSDLSCEGNRIVDLAPLAGMPLSGLRISGNAVVSLMPLRGAPLAHLACYGNRIADLGPLHGMPLTDLHCAFNDIADLEPLRGMTLAALHCQGNRIADLEPLTGMALGTVVCSANRIASLAPLRSSPLQLLDCHANPLQDSAGDLDQPPAALLCDHPDLDDAALAALAQRWEQDDRAGLARQLDLLRRWRARDRAGLRAMAVQGPDRAYLYLPVGCRWDEAREHCEALGGRLAVVPDNEHVRLLGEAVPQPHIAWVGLRRDASGRACWLDGSQQRAGRWKDAWHARMPGQARFEAHGQYWGISMLAEERAGFVVEWAR